MTEILVQKLEIVTGGAPKEIGRYYLVVPMAGVPLQEGSRVILVDRSGKRATGRLEVNHGSLVLDTGVLPKED
jgi:hypothetical protein